MVIRALLRRRIVEPQTIKKCLGIWLLAAVVLFAAALWLAPESRVRVELIAFAVVLFLPMARLAAAPLALDWNRHR